MDTYKPLNGRAERLLYRPEEAAELLAIGRSSCYALIASGRLTSVRIGRSRRVPGDALVDYVSALASAVPDKNSVDR
jgi:excisionase family DNA binding protein